MCAKRVSICRCMNVIGARVWRFSAMSRETQLCGCVYYGRQLIGSICVPGRSENVCEWMYRRKTVIGRTVEGSINSLSSSRETGHQKVIMKILLF